ncbi:MAG TPA: hypothetical protein VNI52_00755 [Sphingobacteriaceae bacterium]|nr:hypothetical protein [Sphingobacteriaceae bacterium]
MEIIKLNDHSGKEIIIKASPIKLKEQQGWKVSFDDGKEAILAIDQHRIWKEVGGNNLAPDFVSQLGAAIDKQITTNG